MPQLVNISTQYRNKLKNGDAFTDNISDFTTNQTGNVMEESQCIITCDVEWFANSDLTDVWVVDDINNIITRTIGNFSTDGFRVGHKFRFISDWSIDNSLPNVFEATIDFIRQDGLRLDFTVTSGVVPATGNYPDVGIRALGNASENYLTGIVYSFGFVENDDTTEFNSLVTGNEMSYQVGNIPRAVSDQDMIPVGTLRDWVTGEAKASFLSESDFVQSFSISHQYIIQPWFRDGETENTKNNIPPAEFSGANSLKHVFKVDFREAISNPNNSITNTLDNNLGSVGFFDENYNGLGKAYEIVSVSYEDAFTNSVDGLQVSLKTIATIEVSLIGGSIPAGQKAGVFVSLLPPQSEYQDKTTTLRDNFIYDSLYHTEGTAATVGTNVIKLFDSSIVGGNLVIVAEFENNNNQQAILSSIANPNYVIGVNIADESLSNALSNRIVLKELNEYVVNNDVDGLITFDKFNFHFADSQIGVDTGFTDFFGWNEDSLAIEFNFYLNLSSLKQAFLNTIGFYLVAYNETTGEVFANDATFFFNLSNIVVSGGVQQIEIDTTRNYLFEEGNQYNKAEITTGIKVGDNQNYSGVIAQKIRWEDWIENRFADTIFYDSGQPQNGLNFKSSNYSGQNDYTIRLGVKSNVQGLDSLGISRATDYLTLSPPITVNDYNVGFDYTCTVELFRASNSSPVGTVLRGENTLIRATFTGTAAITDLTSFWSAIKMQVDNENGQQIREISTTGPDSSELLIPKSGFSLLDMYLDSGNVVAECLVNGDNVAIANYNISARIRPIAVDECFVEFEKGECIQLENGELLQLEKQ